MSRFFKLKKNDTGQTLVEFALILPILLILVMGIIQFGVLFSAQVGVTNAAREGARIASVGNSSADVGTRVNQTLGSHISLAGSPQTNLTYPTGMEVGKDVNVSVSAEFTLLVPLPDVFVPGGKVALRAESIMRLEKVPEAP